jgi:hypothetical protein
MLEDAAAEGMNHVAKHPVFAAILPKMLWASPVWWIGSANIISTLQTTYNAATGWITGLPANTWIPKLLICANLPPLEIYLNYLSRYAIRLLFLPTNHPSPTNLKRIRMHNICLDYSE